MRFNFTFGLLVACTYLVTSPSFAMLDEGQESNVVHTQRSLFESQLENVSKFVAQRQSQFLPIKMVFGAVNMESDRIVDDACIFLDINLHDPFGKPHIQASFNDLDEVGRIAQAVGPHLDQIVVEDSTYKFTEWTSEHLKLFASMLKKGGEFIFSPGVGRPCLETNYTPSADEEVTAAIQALNQFNLQQLPSSYTLPDGIPSEVELNSPEVQVKFEKYEPIEQFQNLSDDDCYDKQCDKFGVMYHPSVFKDSNLLKQAIAKPLKLRKIVEKIEREYYLPHIQKVLEQHFQNVVLAENVTPSVPSRYNKIVSLMFYAKK